MPNITKRTNKDGSTSFYIKVFLDETPDGHQNIKNTVWKAPANMKPSAAEKEAKRQSILFEERVRRGMVSFESATRFGDYAMAWVQNEPLVFKTRKRYEELLERILPAIGHIKLEKLQAHHLEQFYRNLAEPGISKRGQSACSTKLNEAMRQSGLSKSAVAVAASVACSTVNAAANGHNVSFEKAIAISEALKTPAKELFVFKEGTARLSEKNDLLSSPVDCCDFGESKTRKTGAVQCCTRARHSA